MFHTSCNSNSTTTQLQIYTVNPVILNTFIEDYYKVICHEMSFMGMQERRICIQDSEIRFCVRHAHASWFSSSDSRFTSFRCCVSVVCQDMSSLMQSIYEVVDSSVNQSCNSKRKTLRVKLSVTPEPAGRRKDGKHPATGDAPRHTRTHIHCCDLLISVLNVNISVFLPL